MTEQLSIYEKAYDEGYNAFMTGQSDSSCGNPYDYEGHKKQYRGWECGYMDAESDNPGDDEE